MPYPIDHRRFVCSLYKRSLKNIRDWKHDYPEYRRYAMALREQFDLHKNERDERRVWLFLRSVEYLLYMFKHPEPYVFPYDPEGVAHGREVRLPEEFIKNGDGRGKLETLLMGRETDLLGQSALRVLKEQREKLEQTNNHLDDVEGNITRANRHAGNMSRRAAGNKAFLSFVIVLLCISIVGVIYLRWFARSRVFSHA